MKERRGRVSCEKAAIYATKPAAVITPLVTSEPPNTSTTEMAVIPRNSLIGDAACCLRAIERRMSDIT